MQHGLPKLCASLLILSSCASSSRAARVWPGSYLIVLERENADALVIEPNGGQVNDRFATETGPREVAVSRAGQYAVVCNYGDARTAGHTLTFYDLVGERRESLIDIAPHTRPSGIEFLDQRSTVLVTSETSAAVLEIALRGGRVVRTIPTGGKLSRGIALSPDRKRAYTTNTGSGSISVLDTESGTLVATVPTGAAPEAIDVAPNGEIWVGNDEDDKVVVVDPVTLGVVATIAELPLPVRLRTTRNGRLAVVFCAGADEVALIDTRTRTIVARVSLADVGSAAPRRPWPSTPGSPKPAGIVIDPDSKYAFVSDSGADRVVVVDLEERRVRGHYPTGRGPAGLAWAYQRRVPGFLDDDRY